MRLKHLKCSLALIALSLGGACSRYDISVNERLIYSPPPLYRDYDITDKALHKCIADSIADQHLTKAEQLQRLLCPPGTITSLRGISHFKNLKVLGLAGNPISDVEPISSLKELEQLNLASTDIRSLETLQGLEQLRVLNLSGSESVNCEDLSLLSKNIAITQPAHCKKP